MKGLELEGTGFKSENGMILCEKCAQNDFYSTGTKSVLLEDMEWDEGHRCMICGEPLFETNVRGLAILLNGRVYGAAQKLAEKTGCSIPTAHSWIQRTRKPGRIARKVLESLGAEVGVRVRF